MTNNVTGETVQYAYDALNRLSTATANTWAQSFAYDGFGNRTDENLTAGTAPQMHLSIDPNTNHINSTGYNYDNNGNLWHTPLQYQPTYSFDVLRETRDHILETTY